MASVTATTNTVRISPRKLRMVANAIKGQNALYALDGLKFLNRKASVIVYKTLKSAVSNAINNNNLDGERLVVSHVNVGPATTYKRVKLEAKGRVRRILKRNSNITITVTDGNNAVVGSQQTVLSKAAKKQEKSVAEQEAEVVAKPKKAAAKKPAAKKTTKAKK